MKFAAHAMLFTALAATFVHAQTQTNLYPQVQHVIIVVQENRTPDNLFNQDVALAANGGHVQPSGTQINDKCTNGVQPLAPTPFSTCSIAPSASRYPRPLFSNREPVRLRQLHVCHESGT
jgi:hypothetical protein